jgi:hypothetical protein
MVGADVEEATAVVEEATEGDLRYPQNQPLNHKIEAKA